MPCFGDKFGNVADTPQFLTDKGFQISTGNNPPVYFPVDTTQINYITPTVYYETDFNVYGLP